MDRDDSAAVLGTTRFLRAALTIAALFLLVSLAHIADRDVWMDEAWALFLTDPKVDSLALIHDRLSVDMHPPIFNLFVHGMRELIPVGLTAVRLLNALVCLPAIGYIWSVWRRDPATRPVLATYLLILGSGFFFVHFGAEARVYWSLVLTSVCYAVAVLRVMPALMRSQPPARIDWWVWLFTSALLLHLHAYSAIFVTLHGAVNLLLLAQHRRWREAIVYLVWMLFFGLLLVWWYATQTLFLKGMDLGGGWISQLPLLRALRRVGGFALFTAPNLVALAFAAWELPSLWPRQDRYGRPAADRPERIVLCGTALSVLLFSLGIVIGNLFSPLIVDRYFTVFTGPLCLLVAWLAVQRIGRLGPRQQYAAAVGLLLSAVAASVFHNLREPNYWNVGLYWGESAQYAQHAHGSCPYPIKHAASNKTHYVENEYIALTWGAEEMGRQMGFRTERADPGDELHVSPQCPVALWVLLVQDGAEHTSVRELLDELKLTVVGATPDQLEIVPFGSEAVMQLKR